jgi:hypothetical protein
VRHERQERPEHEKQEKCDHHDDLDLELRQRRPPPKKIRFAISAASSVPCATSSGANATTVPERNPRPPTRSGWVGTRLSSQRATCQRKRIQTNRRKYQRSKMNWATGLLTYTNHQPAGNSWRPPSVGTAYQVGTPKAT